MAQKWFTVFAKIDRSLDTSLWRYPLGFSGFLGATPPDVAIRTTKSILLRKPASDLDLAATNNQGILPALRRVYRFERRQAAHQLTPIVQRPTRSPEMLSENFAGQAFQLGFGRLKRPGVSPGGISFALVDLNTFCRRPPGRNWCFPAAVLPGILLRKPQSVVRSRGMTEHRAIACARPFGRLKLAYGKQAVQAGRFLGIRLTKKSRGPKVTSRLNPTPKMKPGGLSLSGF